MWPMVKKEIREHLVIGVGALAANGVLAWMFVVARSGPSDSGMYQIAREVIGVSDLWPPLVDQRLLGYLAIGGAVYGAALGLLQMLSEFVRGTYPFLLHRPTTTRRIYLGKVAAGVVLYFTPLVAPFAWIAWWASRPGSYAGVFDVGMVGPGLLMMAFGFSFYLGGLLVGLSPARWYATRSAGLVAPILLVPFVFASSLMVAVVGVALVGVFLLWAGAATVEIRSF